MNTIPDGCRRDDQGRYVPEALIKPTDLLRDELVCEIVEKARPLRQQLADFKQQSMGDIRALVDLAAEKHKVKLGGRKGNLSLLSYDGRYKVVLKNQNHISFNESIEAAKALIDECLARWTEGSRPEIKALVERAFHTNRQGQLRTSEILSLKNIEIDDEQWQQAMVALMDSITVSGSTSYINIYERVGETDQWQHLSLDLAAV